MVLVDSSIWIEYFRGKEISNPLNYLIDINNICINDLILAELIPSITHKKECVLKELLFAVKNYPVNINWQRIISMQTMNLQNGINKVGIADLIIVQNAIDNNLELYAIDKQFSRMRELHGFKLYAP